MKKLFLLLLPALLFSCSSNDSDDDLITPLNLEETTDAVAYIKGEMNGTAFDYYYTHSLVPQYLYGYINGYSGTGSERSFYYGAELSPTGNFDKRVMIAFNHMFAGSETDESAAFYDTFATIPTNYISAEQDDLHVKGVSVEYQIGDEYYTTMHGSQAGSTFTVTSSTQGIEPGGTLKIKTIIGTYSCKLYNNIDPSDIITITNGKYKVVLREFN